MTLEGYEVWFLTGSQHLYGPETLEQVASQSQAIASALGASADVPVRVVWKPVLTDPAAIRQVMLDANSSDSVIGVIAWMHTFSPAKMWIGGLAALRKPLLHLHTQFNAALPWDRIDMDYMNTHQSAHGDREFGFIETRMRLRRKTVVGHWRDPGTIARIGQWTRAARGWAESQRLQVARFGDNMREVAVTEGDKVEAQLRLGLSVSGFGVGDLVACVDGASEEAVGGLAAEYEECYAVVPELRAGGGRHGSLLDAARIEAGLREFLDSHGMTAFTDTFEDLHGLAQLPGIAAQRLMADGYGFAAEGDWKTAALVRVVKVMTAGLAGGTSFMEDYTYDLEGEEPLVLGAHMLEIGPSIAAERPRCEIHPLSIGAREDPVRLVFTAAPGPALVVSMVDLGDRLRMIANRVEAVTPPAELPRLPVARALWRPAPDFATAAEAWLAAGGAHHTVYSPALELDVLSDFAEIAGVELLVIDERTRMREFANELRWNQAYHRLAGGL